MEGVVMFGGIYAGRRVLVTGHTGFKGGWLSHWLLQLGANVRGIALAPQTTPNLFDLLNLQERAESHLIDIRDADAVRSCMRDFRPEFVFHLAAQPLVRLSYQEPKATWDTNVGGTVNVLEAVLGTPSVQSCLVVTSDKCYDNKEQIWGYRENDALGGHDPYSASKGATELVVASYRRSFFSDNKTCHIASARAGNVIGGGDWANDRIVTDFVTRVVSGRALELRNPQATRPWQHVLEPLSGYLDIAARLFSSEGKNYAEAWNLGPSDQSVTTVHDLATRLVAEWGQGSVSVCSQVNQPHEAGLLKLDCSKAQHRLGWHGVWDVDKTVKRTVEWYRAYYEKSDVVNITDKQIENYSADAKNAGLAWAQSR
jgi:CDP-glucose 4,6-dehydratase